MAGQTLSFVGRWALLLGAVVPAAASAQIYGSFLKNIQQQPANETIKSEVRHADDGEATIPAHSDDFALMKVPTYRLQNGVTLQVSGGFRPGDTVRCVSDCVVPLQSPHR